MKVKGMNVSRKCSCAALVSPEKDWLYSIDGLKVSHGVMSQAKAPKPWILQALSLSSCRPVGISKSKPPPLRVVLLSRQAVPAEILISPKPPMSDTLGSSLPTRNFTGSFSRIAQSSFSETRHAHKVPAVSSTMLV